MPSLGGNQSREHIYQQELTAINYFEREKCQVDKTNIDPSIHNWIII